MASGVREERCALSAHCSSEAAAITDLSEQPETPGPQPRQGAKASVVPVMENAEFSSKLPGFRLPVLAWVVESAVRCSGRSAGRLLAGGRCAGTCREQAAQQHCAQCQSQRTDIFQFHKSILRWSCPGGGPELQE